jgi:arylsulfatase
MLSLRPFISLFLALLWVPLTGCSDSVDHSPESKPNIVFILADDLGYGEVGAFGQEKIETPNIDSLAATGMRFTQHYSGSPVCAPSRCVLMTGKHSGHAYIRGNDEWGGRGDVWDFAKAVEDPNLEGQRPIPADTMTVAKLLRQAGYSTAAVGKWGLGAPLTEGIPNLQGFDLFFGYNCQRQAHTYFPRHLWKNSEKTWLSNDLVVPGTGLADGADPLDPSSYDKFSLEQYAPDLMLKEALGLLDQNKDSPFFLYFASPLPHVPLQAPATLVEKYVKKFGDEQPYLAEKGYFPSRHPHATYAAMVTYLDDQVGQIIERLKSLRVYDNTLVVFTSDNGPTYAGGADSEFFDSARPFRSGEGWGKGNLHEGGIRVPTAVTWPDRIQPGSESDLASVFYDWLPTLSEIAGVPAPKDTDGVSLVGELLGEAQTGHDFLYWEFPSYGGQQAVRWDKWKGIRKNIFEGNLEIELFDLATDPTEQHDVASENPHIVEQILAIMAREHVPSRIERFKFPQLGD